MEVEVKKEVLMDSKGRLREKTIRKRRRKKPKTEEQEEKEQEEAEKEEEDDPISQLAKVKALPDGLGFNYAGQVWRICFLDMDAG